MKLSGLMGMAMAALVITSASVFAGELPSDQVARVEMNQLQIDAGLGLENVSMAMLSVNYTELTAHLTLSQLVGCPQKAGQFNCFAISVKPVLEIDLPIVSEGYDVDNNFVIVARRDSRGVDGALETLTIVDTSRSLKPTIGLTRVTYQTSIFDRRTGSELTTQSTLTGGQLELVNQN